MQDTILDSAIPQPIDEAVPARQRVAIMTLCASVLLGLLGDLVFFNTSPGINISVYTLAFLAIALGLLTAFERPIAIKHALFAPLALLFALLLAVRSAPQIFMFNLITLMGSLAVVVCFITEPRFLGGSWIRAVKAAIVLSIIGWLDGLYTILPESAQWTQRISLTHRQLTHMKSGLRGVLLALPILLVFALLLASADAVFSDLAWQGMNLLLPDSPQNLITHGVIVIFFTILGMTGLKPMLFDHGQPAASPTESAATKPLIRLDIIETSIVMGSVNALFALFVAVQARYFFGGAANINARGYTYAEYARRGFYELLAVSCMTMLLIVTLDAVTYRKRTQERIFQILVAGMIGLTLVILVAAYRRLDLYENAYGFTRIRVMSGVFMFWLALLMGLLLFAIRRRQRAIFWVGCAVAGLGFGLTLNVMNMDGFIAHHNIERFEHTGKIDIPYLMSLSNDAIPAIVPLLENPRLDTSQQQDLRRRLEVRAFYLRQENINGFSYHFGTARAVHAVEHIDSYVPR